MSTYLASYISYSYYFPHAVPEPRGLKWSGPLIVLLEYFNLLTHEAESGPANARPWAPALTCYDANITGTRYFSSCFTVVCYGHL